MEPTLHSFGGSALDRYLFDYEAVIDGGAASAGVDPASAPAGDVQASVEGAPSPEPATPAEAAPTIDWAAPEARQAIAAGTVEALQSFVAQQQEAAQAAANAEPEFDWDNIDPFDGNQLAQGLRAMLKETLDERLGPVDQIVQREAQRDSQAWTAAQFERLQVPEEDRGLVLYMGGGLEQAATAGGYRVDGGQIMQLAHQQLQEHDKRVGDKAVEAYIASINAVRDAPHDPAARVAAADGFPADEDELATARRMMAGRNAA